uniref:alpha-N-acetylgalactosaminide alpha-2,6-sialyltransferase n=1 Tax=Astyanax mexicanus TaxID=7994 RepID=A0A8B9KBE3_ASTMX
MYLYQNQLNLSEWNRLSHFNNPFGFMEYNYTGDAVDLIQKPNITQLLPLPANESCIRCAVVANGGILNGSKMGKEIDSHTYVFRMNGAVIEGHEEDVGNRTSVYVHTSFSLIASLIAYRKYGFKNVPNDEVSASFCLFMTSKQQNGTYWAMYRPTNGAFTLFLALHVCDIVDAYGFITENHKSFSNYYYENKKTEVVFFINHDYNLEIKLWKKLHDDKLIRLYQREGGQT